ncbi:hypothetical protein [Haladaptatus salinisoli]|nr:hypothetical protein [Haladaptatus salinisoli]
MRALTQFSRRTASRTTVRIAVDRVPVGRPAAGNADEAVPAEVRR